MYANIFNKNIWIRNADLHQGKEETTPRNKRETKYVYKYI